MNKKKIKKKSRRQKKKVRGDGTKNFREYSATKQRDKQLYWQTAERAKLLAIVHNVNGLNDLNLVRVFFPHCRFFSFSFPLFSERALSHSTTEISLRIVRCTINLLRSMSVNLSLTILLIRTFRVFAINDGFCWPKKLVNSLFSSSSLLGKLNCVRIFFIESIPIFQSELSHDQAPITIPLFHWSVTLENR